MKNFRFLGTQKATNLAPAAMIFHMWFPEMMSPPNLALPTETFKCETVDLSKEVTSDNYVFESLVSILNHQDVWNSGKSKGSTTQLVSRNSAINWAMIQSKELQLYNTYKFDAFSLPFPVCSNKFEKVQAEVFHDVRHQTTA